MKVRITRIPKNNAAKWQHHDGGKTGPENYDPNAPVNLGYTINPNDIYPAQPSGSFFEEAYLNPSNYPGAPVNTNQPEQAQFIAPRQATLTPATGDRSINQTPQTLQTEKQPLLGRGINALQQAGQYLNKNKGDIAREGAVGVLNNLGNLAYLVDQGKRYDQVDYGRVNPTLLSDRESLRQIQEGYNTGQYNLRNSGRFNQSGAIALSSERMKQAAAAKERIANINAGITNQFGQYNKGLQVQGMVDTAQNKGQALTNYYTALGATGQNVAAQRRDYLQRQADKQKMNLLGQMYANQRWNPVTGQWEFAK